VIDDNPANTSMKLLLLHLVILTTFISHAKKPKRNQKNERASLLGLTNDYSTFELPFKYSPNLIKIGFEISDVLAINDKDYSITFGLYFSVEWLEPRLNLSKDLWSESNRVSELELVPVNLELIKNLWLPNIFIYNLKSFKTIDVLSKLAGLWIDSKKRIYYSQATHITFICPMVFDSFPLDTQRCKFQVGSYSYDMTRMVFDVSTLGYIQNTQSIILDYDIEIMNLKNKDQLFEAGALGNFSLAGFEMKLSRHVMSYIITYYLPSGLFVLVSWISFLIPPDIVPGRMALLITLFLVLVNIFNNINSNSPKAEGLTAIEIWMLACILFVFGALIVYAAILNQKLLKSDDKKQIKKKKRSKAPEEQSVAVSGSLGQGANGEEAVLMSYHNGSSSIVLQSQMKEMKVERSSSTSSLHLNEKIERKPAPPPQKSQFSTWNYQHSKVDRFFLVLAPILFLIFNTIYWGYFYVWDKFINPHFPLGLGLE